jgi:hypothetical protein
MAKNLLESVRLAPNWDDLADWVKGPQRDHMELRDLCRRFDLPATGNKPMLRRTLLDYIGGKRNRTTLVPGYAVAGRWSPALIGQYGQVQIMKKTPWPAVAFDPEVLKFVAPAYAVPLADVVLSAAGIVGMGWLWPFLLAPAAGFHVLITLNVLSRRREFEADDVEAAGGDLLQTQKALVEGFDRIKSSEGLKALQDLVYEYNQLQPVLSRRRSTDSIAVGQLPVLASEAYRQGISVLQDALDLMQASGPEDTARLQAENADIEREIAQLSRDASQAARVKIRRERLASNKELLALIDKQQERIDELLYQCDRCAASLHRTRMELAALRADASDESVSGVVDTLRLTIGHARSVQDEMKRLTSGGGFHLPAPGDSTPAADAPDETSRGSA